MPDAVIAVEGLRKEFGGVVAVCDSTFTVPRGGSVAIVGESGSGKTTVARCLVGLERPTRGQVSIAGVRLSDRRLSSRRRRELSRQIQLVYQDPYSSLDPRQTVGAALGEVVRLHLGLDAAARRDRVAELLEQVGLPETAAATRPRRLSGGQRQRVVLARALAAEPEVIVLDESVAALDVSVQAQILNLLAEIRAARGLSYVFISHDLAVVRQVSDEILVMHRGEIVERGATTAVLDDPQHEHTRRLIAAVPAPGFISRHRRAERA